MQNSFASQDAMQCLKFRDVVDKSVKGWEMVQLIEPGVEDRSWCACSAAAWSCSFYLIFECRSLVASHRFPRWRAELDRSNACLVVFTDTYRCVRPGG